MRAEAFRTKCRRCIVPSVSSELARYGKTIVENVGPAAPTDVGLMKIVHKIMNQNLTRNRTKAEGRKKTLMVIQGYMSSISDFLHRSLIPTTFSWHIFDGLVVMIPACQTYISLQARETVRESL